MSMVSATGTDTSSRLSGLARKLIADGLLSEEQARQANEEALKNKVSFVAQLVDSKTLDAYTIAETGAREFGIPLFDITTIDPEALAAKAVEEKLVRKHQALPLFRRGIRLFVAVSDPTNIQALDEIKFQSGLSIEAVLVEHDRLTHMIEKAMAAHEVPLMNLFVCVFVVLVFCCGVVVFRVLGVAVVVVLLVVCFF